MRGGEKGERKEERNREEQWDERGKEKKRRFFHIKDCDRKTLFCP